MPPIDRSFPAECLRAFRAWLGLSQDDIASILGVSTRSVQMYEGQGGPEWLRRAAARPGPRLAVPDRPPVDPYLSERLPI